MEDGNYMQQINRSKNSFNYNNNNRTSKKEMRNKKGVLKLCKVEKSYPEQKY
jgi:hypothetical protein